MYCRFCLLVNPSILILHKGPSAPFCAPTTHPYTPHLCYHTSRRFSVLWSLWAQLLSLSCDTEYAVAALHCTPDGCRLGSSTPTVRIHAGHAFTHLITSQVGRWEVRLLAAAALTLVNLCGAAWDSANVDTFRVIPERDLRGNGFALVAIRTGLRRPCSLIAMFDGCGLHIDCN
jgi:hypothetical protein